MKLTTRKLRNMLYEMFRDAKTERGIRRAQAGLDYETLQTLEDIESTGDREAQITATSLARSLGSEEPDPPYKMSLTLSGHKTGLYIAFISLLGPNLYKKPATRDELVNEMKFGLTSRVKKNPFTFHPMAFQLVLQHFLEKGYISEVAPRTYLMKISHKQAKEEGLVQ